MDYAGRIENFLTEYLGSSRHLVPFGGRGAEMAILDSWLNSGGLRPYALMAANAGRGKSALVTRWCRTLTARPDICVILLPISIRFRTNLASVVFASLAARLTRIFGEEIKAAGERFKFFMKVLRKLNRPLAGEAITKVEASIERVITWWP